MDRLKTLHHLLASRASEAQGNRFELYHYEPSTAAAILFAILFSLTTALHAYQLLRTKTWFYISFLLGGLFEIIGYVFRAVNASEQYQQWSLLPFILQSVLLLVAPALFAASIYMELGRVVELVDGDKYLFIRRKRMTATFVTGDIFSFFLQAGGGGLMGTKDLDMIHTGEKVIVGGLFVQILFFGMFVITAYLFHLRMHKRSTSRGLEVPWKKHMFAMYFVSILILIRSIFRVIEFLQGNDGYLLRSEVFLYVFDAALMLLVMLCMNWIHPSEIRSFLRGGSWTKGFRVKESALEFTGRQHLPGP